MDAKIGDTVKITRGYDQKFEGMVGEILAINNVDISYQVKLHEHNYVWCREVEIVNIKNSEKKNEKTKI